MARKEVTAVREAKSPTDNQRKLIAERAYLKWLAQSNGGQHPVADEQTNLNWLEAEQEITGNE
jgi:hypothetical protein